MMKFSKLMGVFLASAVAALPGGDSAIVSYGSVGSRERLIRLDQHGRFLWERTYRGGRTPVAVVAHDDSSVVVAGRPRLSGLSGWLAKHDQNGDLLWTREVQITPAGGPPSAGCKLQSLASNLDPSGQQTSSRASHAHGCRARRVS